RVRGEERQQVELGVGEHYLARVVEDAAFVEVDDEIFELEPPLVDSLLVLARLAQVGRDAGEQLAGPERLRDVVVRADLQPGHDIDLFGLATEDDDRHPQSRLTDITAYVEPGNVGQHDVKQNQVGLAQLDPAERLAAG